MPRPSDYASWSNSRRNTGCRDCGVCLCEACVVDRETTQGRFCGCTPIDREVAAAAAAAAAANATVPAVAAAPAPVPVVETRPDADRYFENRRHIKSKLMFHRPTARQLIFNRSPRFLSMEIEVSSLKKNYWGVYDVCAKWGAGIVGDGSLPSGGFEINTSPAGGDLFIQQIKEICAELKKGEAVANHQCGLHIHGDGRDLSYYDLRRLIQLYAVVEDGIYKMNPRARSTSTYCIKCGTEYLLWLQKGGYKVAEPKKAVFSATYRRNFLPVKDKANGEAQSKKRLGRDKYNGNRYNGLNMHSWFHRGSVECRVHAGSVNEKTIINWGLIWARLMDCSKKPDSYMDSLVSQGTNPVNRLISMVSWSPKLSEYINKRVQYFDQNTNQEIVDMP